MSRAAVSRSLRILLGGARLTLRGLWFLSLGVSAVLAGYVFGMPVLLYVGSFLVALPLVALLFVRTRESTLAISRRFSSPVVEAGSTTTVTVHVDNRSRRATSPVRWRDSLPWKPWLTQSGWLSRLSVAAGLVSDTSAAQLGYSLTPTDRGVFEIGPLVLEATDPFELAWGAWNIGAKTPLIVTPRVVQLSPTALRAESGDGEARVVQRRATGDDDDAMTREYRRGDAMRRVHWKASARHGSLMVRQEEQHSYPQARIIVDTQLAGYPDANGQKTIRAAGSHQGSPTRSANFEWVVSMLASAAVQLRREGFLLQIVETGPPQLSDAAVLHRRSAAEQELLTRLATFTPMDTPPDWWPAPQTASAFRGPLIALVSSPGAETIDFLLSQPTTEALAVAFIVATESHFGDRARLSANHRPSLAEELQDAGWRVIAVQPGDEVADSWDLYVAESRQRRVND